MVQPEVSVAIKIALKVDQHSWNIVLLTNNWNKYMTRSKKKSMNKQLARSNRISYVLFLGLSGNWWCCTRSLMWQDYFVYRFFHWWILFLFSLSSRQPDCLQEKPANITPLAGFASEPKIKEHWKTCYFRIFNNNYFFYLNCWDIFAGELALWTVMFHIILQ